MKKKPVITTDELLDSPGTYFNPSTEITVTVDDTNYVDISNVDLDKYSGKEWILISDDPLNNTSQIEETLQIEIEEDGGVQGTNDLSDTAKDQQG